ncbi:MAG TPA: serine/threonine-protein kinase, partial [Polyangiaceae bacterium]|nr:serine/threonine-protein kinase [Polyangiaceae bacterium]
LDHGVDEGVPFIVMELLDGESLASRLERVQRLSPADTARIITQVARAIARAHEAGIVHRDLKPDNIYLVRNDEEEIAKVLDFGVAKATTHGMGAVTGATRTGSVLGTPYYMSPEQAEGAKTVDGRSDLWSLGVIAWECLLGNRPFESETLGGLLLAICARPMPTPSTMGVVPPGFDAWFARACSRDVSHRFGSAKELAQELRAVCGGAGMQGYGYAAPPASSSQGGVVQAASFPLASTTAHLGLSSSNGEPEKKKSAAPLVALLSGVVLLGLGGAFFALRDSFEEDTVASAVPSTPAAPVEQKAAAAEPPPVEPPPAVASVAPAPSNSPAPAAPAVAAPARRPAARPAPAARPTPKPAEKPAPVPAEKPAPAPSPASKPRVNLGI